MPFTAANAACSLGRWVETPTTAAPSVANSPSRSRYVHDSSVQPMPPGISSAPGKALPG